MVSGAALDTQKGDIEDNPCHDTEIEARGLSSGCRSC